LWRAEIYRHLLELSKIPKVAHEGVPARENFVKVF
jgi:hypothetical protein